MRIAPGKFNSRYRLQVKCHARNNLSTSMLLIMPALGQMLAEPVSADGAYPISVNPGWEGQKKRQKETLALAALA